jgi:hypothetical protein
VGRGGRDRPAAHLRRPARRTCPDAAGQPPRHTHPGGRDKRPDPLGESHDRRGHGDRSHIRRREAFSDPHAAGLRAAPSPALADAHGIEIPLPVPFALIVEFADALRVAVGFSLPVALSVALPFPVALALPVAEVLRPYGRG